MGLWPGDAHFSNRYDRATEYVQVIRELRTPVQIFKSASSIRWTTAGSRRDRRWTVPIVSAGSVAARYEVRCRACRLQLRARLRREHPVRVQPTLSRACWSQPQRNRDATWGRLALFMVIADETDERPGEVG